MAVSKTDELVGLIGDVRHLFHLLRMTADELHRSLGVTAALRAVLESLSRGGPQTVPAMARARPVSRQHIQVIVDRLLAQGLVELRDNPAHRKSSLVALTTKGRQMMKTITAREGMVLPGIAARFSAEQFGAARETLRLLQAVLKERMSSSPRGDEAED